MLSATCHCGAVRIEIPRKPRQLTNCNCSICRRYGALWAYYNVSDVSVTHPPGGVEDYVWGDKSLKFVRCTGCGCVTHWAPITAKASSKMGVNIRNFEPRDIGAVRIRLFDGATTWKFVD